MISTKPIYSCFETLERWGDTITGPFCVTFAWGLILQGTFCFYDVIAPSLTYPFISIPICLLITLNLYMHYYYAITVSPGFIDDPPRDPVNSFLWARKVKDEGKQATIQRGAIWSEKGVEIMPGSPTECRKCTKSRPERSHHCRTCNKCVLKYDHHCPWVNQCVGLHNERHFVLFMSYLILATSAMIMLGFQHFIHAFIHSLGIIYREWPHHVSEKWFVAAYTICVVFCFAVSMIFISSLFGVVYGETMSEAHKNEEYCKEAKERDQEFVNSYDCGKLKNLQLFFNIGEGGYSKLTLFLPFRLDPYTDGHSWARKAGYEKRPAFRKARRGQMMTMLYKFLLLN